jgi:hypothetical protein
MDTAKRLNEFAARIHDTASREEQDWLFARPKLRAEAAAIVNDLLRATAQEIDAKRTEEAVRVTTQDMAQGATPEVVSIKEFISRAQREGNRLRPLMSKAAANYVMLRLGSFPLSEAKMSRPEGGELVPISSDVIAGYRLALDVLSHVLWQIAKDTTEEN